MRRLESFDSIYMIYRHEYSIQSFCSRAQSRRLSLVDAANCIRSCVTEPSTVTLDASLTILIAETSKVEEKDRKKLKNRKNGGQCNFYH
jgi:monomeric isocitrate dehydrogenase